MAGEVVGGRKDVKGMSGFCALWIQCRIVSSVSIR